VNVRSHLDAAPAFRAEPNTDAEHRLSETEAQYRAVFDAVGDGLEVWDLETGRLVEVNDAECRMHGYTREELLADPAPTIVHPDDLHLTRLHVEVVRAGREFRGRMRDVRKDGTVLPVEVIAKPFSYNGQPSMLGVIRDISAEVQAYERLEDRVAERTRELTTLLDVSQSVSSTLDLDDLLGRLLDRLKDVVEYSAVDIRTLQDGYPIIRGYRGPLPRAWVVGIRSLPEYLPHLDDILRDRQPLIESDLGGDYALMRLHAATGDAIPTEAIGHARAFMVVPLMVRGEVTGTLNLFHTTPGYYTPRHADLAMAFAQQAAIALENARLYGQAEELARSEGRERQAAEAQYLSVFDAVGDGLEIWDLDTGRLIEVNPAHCRMHGYTRDQLLGDPAPDFIHPDDVDVFDRARSAVIAGQEYRCRVRDLHQNGTVVPVEVVAKSIAYRGRSCMLCIVHDISAEVRSAELLEQRVVERTAELTTLLEAGRELASAQDLRPLLESLLDHLEALVPHAGTAILVRDGDQLRYAAIRGGPDRWDEAQHVRYPLVPDRGVWERWCREEPVMIADVLDESLEARLFRSLVAGETELDFIRSLVWVPLIVEGRFVGLMSVTRSTLGDVPQAFTPREIDLALGVGRQVAVAIEQAQLRERVRETAVLEERQRLARELHDSVTQGLFSLKLFAEAANRQLAAGAIEMASAHLRELRATAGEALAEMRLLVFELRPPLLEERGLAAALRTRLDAVEARSGLTTTSDLDERLRLTAPIEQEIYRIAQEALNNVLKHAHASRVSVTFQGDQQVVRLEIVDDGEGFDSHKASGGYGIESMRERARRLGGTLLVESAPGRGTHLRLEVPRCRRT
jgi:PAS domain S-box-containing protein